MPTSTETIPLDIAETIANLKPLEETEGWIKNQHRLNGIKNATRYLSWLRPNLDPEILTRLHEYDGAATDEAKKDADFLHYEPGEVNPEDPFGLVENWCGWRSHEAARAAIHRPDHMGSAVYAITQNVYRYALIESSDVIETGDPKKPFITEPLRYISLPEMQAHYLAHTSSNEQ